MDNKDEDTYTIHEVLDLFRKPDLDANRQAYAKKYSGDSGKWYGEDTLETVRKKLIGKLPIELPETYRVSLPQTVRTTAKTQELCLAVHGKPIIPNAIAGVPLACLNSREGVTDNSKSVTLNIDLMTMARTDVRYMEHRGLAIYSIVQTLLSKHYSVGINVHHVTQQFCLTVKLGRSIQLNPGLLYYMTSRPEALRRVMLYLEECSPKLHKYSHEAYGTATTSSDPYLKRFENYMHGSYEVERYRTAEIAKEIAQEQIETILKKGG